MKTKVAILVLALLLLLVLPGCFQTETPDVPVTVASTVPDGIPEAALDYAKDCVKIRIEELGEAGCPVKEAEITGMTRISTGVVGLWNGVDMYALACALTPAEPAKLPAECTLDADGRITAAGKDGEPYLLLYWEENDEGTVWERMTVLYTARIEGEYNTPDMIEKYGDPYTAACAEALDMFRENGKS